MHASEQGMACQGRAGQKRTAYVKARNGMARQEQGQEHIQRRAVKSSGRGRGSGMGMNRFKAGQDRAG